MRILMGVHALPPESIGGTELSALGLAQALARENEVTLFHPLREASPRGLEHIRFVRGVRLIGRAFPPPSSFAETYCSDEVDRWFQSILDRFPADICHFHHLTGLSAHLPALTRSRGIPTVLTLHDYWMLCARGQRLDLELQVCPGPTPKGCATCLSDQILLDRSLGKMTRRGLGLLPQGARLRVLMEYGKKLYQGSRSSWPTEFETERAAARTAALREALGAVDLVTAPSRDLLDYYVSQGLKREKCRWVDHGFAARTPKPPLLGPPPPLKVGFIGALIPSKGPDILLKAIKGLPRGRAECTLIGPAPLYHRRPGFSSELRAMAGQVGARILEPIPPEEVPGWIRRFHLLVLPSIWPENAPLILGEAFLEGVPVVASAIGGIPERVIHRKNGLLFRAGDHTVLTGILLNLLENPSELEELRRNARTTELPSDSEQLRKWKETYEELIRAG